MGAGACGARKARRQRGRARTMLKAQCCLSFCSPCWRRPPCRRWRCCCCCSGAGAASASGAASVSAAATAGRTAIRARGARAFTLQIENERAVKCWLSRGTSAGAATRALQGLLEDCATTVPSHVLHYTSGALRATRRRPGCARRQPEQQHGSLLTCGPRRPHGPAPEQTPTEGTGKQGGNSQGQRRAYLGHKEQHAFTLHAPAE